MVLLDPRRTTARISHLTHLVETNKSAIEALQPRVVQHETRFREAESESVRLQMELRDQHHELAMFTAQRAQLEQFWQGRMAPVGEVCAPIPISKSPFEDAAASKRAQLSDRLSQSRQLAVTLGTTCDTMRAELATRRDALARLETELDFLGKMGRVMEVKRVLAGFDADEIRRINSW